MESIEEKAEFDKRLAAIDIFVKHLGDDALYFGRKNDFENAMIEYGDACVTTRTTELTTLFSELLSGDTEDQERRFGPGFWKVVLRKKLEEVGIVIKEK